VDEIYKENNIIDNEENNYRTANNGMEISSANKKSSNFRIRNTLIL